jgi:hypothetical protein
VCPHLEKSVKIDPRISCLPRAPLRHISQQPPVALFPRFTAPAFGIAARIRAALSHFVFSGNLCVVWLNAIRSFTAYDIRKISS